MNVREEVEEVEKRNKKWRRETRSGEGKQEVANRQEKRMERKKERRKGKRHRKGRGRMSQ